MADSSDLERAGLLTGEPRQQHPEGAEDSDGGDAAPAPVANGGARARRRSRVMILPVALAAGLLLIAYGGSAVQHLAHPSAAGSSTELFDWGAFRGAINGVLDAAQDSASSAVNATAQMHGQITDQAATWGAYYNQMKQQVQGLSPKMQERLQGLRTQMHAHTDEIQHTVSNLRQTVPDLSTEVFEEKMELLKAQFPKLSYSHLKTMATKDFQRRWKEEEAAFDAKKTKHMQEGRASFSKLFGKVWA